MITALSPSSVAVTGTPDSYVLHPLSFNMAGGGGLRLGSGQDAAKVVSRDHGCGAGTAVGGIVTDLGPGDSMQATQASTSITFTAAGWYQMCYAPYGGVT